MHTRLDKYKIKLQELQSKEVALIEEMSLSLCNLFGNGTIDLKDPFDLWCDGDLYKIISIKIDHGIIEVYNQTGCPYFGLEGFDVASVVYFYCHLLKYYSQADKRQNN